MKKFMWTCFIIVVFALIASKIAGGDIGIDSSSYEVEQTSVEETEDTSEDKGPRKRGNLYGNSSSHEETEEYDYSESYSEPSRQMSPGEQRRMEEQAVEDREAWLGTQEDRYEMWREVPLEDLMDAIYSGDERAFWFYVEEWIAYDVYPMGDKLDLYLFCDRWKRRNPEYVWKLYQERLAEGSVLDFSDFAVQYRNELQNDGTITFVPLNVDIYFNGYYYYMDIINNG